MHVACALWSGIEPPRTQRPPLRTLRLEVRRTELRPFLLSSIPTEKPPGELHITKSNLSVDGEAEGGGREHRVAVVVVVGDSKGVRVGA